MKADNSRTNKEVAHPVKIRLHFDSRSYITEVKHEKNPDARIKTSIIVDDESVVGDQNDGITGRPCSFLFQMLDSIESIHNDEFYLIEFSHGPYWTGLHPRGEDVLVVGTHVIAGARDPEARLDIDTARLTSKREWTAAVLETVSEFTQRLLEIDGMSSDDCLSALERRTDELEGFLQELE